MGKTPFKAVTSSGNWRYDVDVEVVDAEFDEVSESKKAFDDSFSSFEASKALNSNFKSVEIL